MNVVMASISSLEILSGGNTGMIPKGALIWRLTTAAECPANGGANDEPRRFDHDRPRTLYRRTTDVLRKGRRGLELPWAMALPWARAGHAIAKNIRPANSAPGINTRMSYS